jgi:hypothetical protein
MEGKRVQERVGGHENGLKTEGEDRKGMEWKKTETNGGPFRRGGGSTEIITRLPGGSLGLEKLFGSKRGESRNEEERS